MEARVEIKAGWQSHALWVKPRVDVTVIIDTPDQDALAGLQEQVLHIATAAATEMRKLVEPQRVTVGGLAEFSAAYGATEVAESPLVPWDGEPGDDEIEPGERVKVTGILLVDEKVGHMVTTISQGDGFEAVAEAIEATAREYRQGDPDSAAYDGQWPIEVIAATRDEQPVQLVSQQRVQEYEREHTFVSNAYKVVGVAEAITSSEEAMRVLDTAYGNGRGGVRLGVTLGTALREIVGSNLPVSPGLARKLAQPEAGDD